MNGFDLHTHTTASDGTHSPETNVRLAKEAGLAGIAITDHDTVAGVAEAAACGEQIGIKVVPGVEISTAADGKDIHVLGYWIDTKDERFLQRLAGQRNTRGRRNEMILQKLAELGYEVTEEEVLAQAAARPGKDGSVGRPHIASAMVAKGYVGSIAEAFDRFLAEGSAAYVNPERISPEEAVRWILEAGGVPVLAHPGLYGDDKLVERLIGCGLKGIEVRHADHAPEDEARYGKMAEAFGLIATAGSDFHGERGGQVFHAPLGSRRADFETVERLRIVSETIRKEIYR